MTPAEYKKALKGINLSGEQKEKILKTIEDLMNRVPHQFDSMYFAGVADGFNKMYKFFSGTLDDLDYSDD